MGIVAPKELTYLESKEKGVIDYLWRYLHKYLTPMHESDPDFSKRKLLKFMDQHWKEAIAVYVRSRRYKENLRPDLFIKRHKLKIKLLVPDFKEMI